MEVIRVHLRAPVPGGYLLYHHDAEVDEHLLWLKTPASRPWSYKVEIDSQILFGLDAERMLVSLEILLGRHLWRVVPLEALPVAVQPARLEFSRATLRQRYFEMPVEITTNESRSYLWIQIGLSEQSAIWVALSNQCLALIAGDRLKGFFVALK